MAILNSALRDVLSITLRHPAIIISSFWKLNKIITASHAAFIYAKQAVHLLGHGTHLLFTVTIQFVCNFTLVDLSYLLVTGWGVISILLLCILIIPYCTVLLLCTFYIYIVLAWFKALMQDTYSTTYKAVIFKVIYKVSSHFQSKHCAVGYFWLIPVLEGAAVA